jgi:hypothetical protein
VKLPADDGWYIHNCLLNSLSTLTGAHHLSLAAHYDLMARHHAAREDGDDYPLGIPPTPGVSSHYFIFGTHSLTSLACYAL